MVNSHNFSYQNIEESSWSDIEIRLALYRDNCENENEPGLLHIDVPRKDIAIVIVEDSEDLVRVYEKFFGMAGLRVTAKFSSAKDLLSNLNSNKIVDFADSIILLESKLHGVDSLEAARQLKKLNPNQRIILATGEYDLSIPQSEDQKLFDGIIRKPFTLSELLALTERMSSQIRIKGSWIFSGEDLDRIYYDILADSKDKVCMCLSGVGVKRRLDIPGYIPYYVRAKSKGMKVMLLTDITRDNLFYCKELMVNRGVELRHLRGVVMNFSVWDEKHALEAVLSSEGDSILKDVFYSNVESTVIKNQFLFNKLWNEAVPGEERIRELEASGGESRGVTLISGGEKIISVVMSMINNARDSVEVCGNIDDRIRDSLPGIRGAWIEAAKRGAHSRQVTQVTRENIHLCKALIEMGVELRHVDDLKGGFIANETEILSVATSGDSTTGLQYLYSNLPLFVEQHRSIFKNLWNAATPASAKISEIENRCEKEIENN